MGLHGFPPISPLSAAHVLVSWADVHGRFPMATECRAVQGLPHWNVFYRTFHCSTFSGILSMAQHLVQTTTSAVSVKMRTCLGPGCEATFKDEGAHVRMCTQCRRQAGTDDMSMVGRSELRSLLTKGRDWFDDVAW